MICLKATAVWTTRWFNKPKFHILLHLNRCIIRFGPAPFFATEGFEAQNAVIRLESLHSNRHAPSRDIGCAFSFMHAVCHLVCGGWYYCELEAGWQQAGSAVLSALREQWFAHLIGATHIYQNSESWIMQHIDLAN